MSDDPRITYLDSREAYEAARSTAQAHIDFIHGVGQTMKSSLAGFVETSLEGKKSAIHAAHDLSRWPSAETLRGALTALNAAFAVCHEKWGDVPHERQAGLAKPPAKLGDA